MTETTRVLLAEHDEDLRHFIARQLTVAGMTVIEVEDGLALREQLSQTIVDVDVVVTDVSMPGASAFEALEQVPRATPPVVMMTAGAGPSTRERAGQAKVAAFFEKPFVMRELVAAIQRIVGPAANRGITAAGRTRASGQTAGPCAAGGGSAGGAGS